MMMAVMLSPPMPRVSFGSAAKHASSISEATLESLADLASSSPPNPWTRWRTKSTTSWLLMTSQTPSQASTMNSSSSLSSHSVMSGSAVMTWSLGSMLLSPLYFKSPMARERLRFPLTRWCPFISCTNPPAFSMRVLSRMSAGLWSTLSAWALPPRQMTARESPAHPTTRCLPWRQATTAVHPACTSCSGSVHTGGAPGGRCPGSLMRLLSIRSRSRLSFITVASSWAWAPSSLARPAGASAPAGPLLGPSRGEAPSWRPRISCMYSPPAIISSMRWKERTMAGPRVGRALPPCFSAASSLASSSQKCFSQNLATSWPPWPSKTAKSAVSSAPSGSASTVRCASSIDLRQPCMALAP
mmetsp:Transcript_2723/g.7503  ORF Transcript_2723/g.7503 Transcript_2723/m.7503 type:complete len:357 (-) Transcript_2723:106-1176(-)